MPDLINMNRTETISLPSEVSAEILQKTQEGSAIMRLARQITLPGRGVTIPVITGDPTAQWVAETAAKPVSNPTVTTKLMTPYKLAVIETFSMEFVRDAAALYDALIKRLPAALARQFDATVIGAVAKPGDNFDNFANCNAQSIMPGATGTGTYIGLVDADTDIATHGGILNGFALSAQARGLMLSAVDGNKRPLFLNSATEGAIDKLLGQPVYHCKGIYKAGTAAVAASGTLGQEGYVAAVEAVPAIVGVAGDWTQAMYGTVEGVRIAISDQATVGNINLWEQNMVAVRAEIEIGFRADTSCFNLLTGATPSAD